MTQVKIINHSNNEIPKYSTVNSAGMDLRDYQEKDIVLKPLERSLIPTGLHIELPEGFEAQIRPRSGLAVKYGISIVNSPGTIDADYRGEIKVILINLSNVEFIIKNGERICQMVIKRYEKVSLIEVSTLNETDRGVGGFGHTGTKQIKIYKEKYL